MYVDFLAETLIFMRHPESLLNRLSDLAKQGDTGWLELFKPVQVSIPEHDRVLDERLLRNIQNTDYGKLPHGPLDSRLTPLTTTTTKSRKQYAGTINGKKQAKKTGKWLREHFPRCDHVYDSGFKRVKEGLRLMGYTDSITDERLAEYDHGDWEFLSQAERLALATSNEAFSGYITDPYHFAPPNGHSFAYDEHELVIPFLKDIAKVDAKIILCGTHGIKLQLIRKLFEHQTEEEFLRDNNDKAKRFENCELLIYTRRSPKSQRLYKKMRYVRRVLPWKMESTTEWRLIIT
ncbi:MAG: hypothetical protein JWO50_11 [Candidatus Kaiserbacteria bacterium]|nr:hypothetical protein [Candidatus Kaiserbacteria bacterium]